MIPIGGEAMDPIEEISELIGSFKDLTGVGVCFYDLEDFFHYNSFGKRENVGHYCKLCTAAKMLRDGRTLCDKSDRSDAAAKAHIYKAPFFTKCHLGMCELAVPIYVDEHLKGLVFLGQCRIENEDASLEVGEQAARKGGSREEFIGLYKELPVIGRNALLSMGRIMQIYFNSLSKTDALFAADKAEAYAGKDVSERMKLYIERNYRMEITPGSVADTFYLSQSYAARTFKKAYGVTLTDYISLVRVRHAEELIREYFVPIRSVALNVGFSDANYFSRVFLKYTGMTPSEARHSARSR